MIHTYFDAMILGNVDGARRLYSGVYYSKDLDGTVYVSMENYDEMMNQFNA